MLLTRPEPSTSNSPEHAGESICSQVVDKHDVSQAGQRVPGVAHLLLQKAWNLLPLQQRVVHKAGQRLSDSTEGVL